MAPEGASHRIGPGWSGVLVVIGAWKNEIRGIQAEDSKVGVKFSTSQLHSPTSTLGWPASDLGGTGCEVGESTFLVRSPAFGVHRSASDLGAPT